MLQSDDDVYKKFGLHTYRLNDLFGCMFKRNDFTLSPNPLEY